jgi:hypothetical protein
VRTKKLYSKLFWKLEAVWAPRYICTLIVQYILAAVAWVRSKIAYCPRKAVKVTQKWAKYAVFICSELCFMIELFSLLHC